ncbi:MAG TPA: LPS assembly lipoprotein LptE [Chitinophagaceae bacterium]
MNQRIKIFFLVALIVAAAAMTSCHVYSFRDVSIPAEVKTVKIGLFENRARYVNPQLSPRLTDAFNQKVSRQTKLTRTNDEDAHYNISGYISQYDVTTAGISGQRTATNRLTVGVHIILRNTLENKTEEYDVSRSFDFNASLTLPQAEAQLLDEIIRNVSDEMFNRIFSNW